MGNKGSDTIAVDWIDPELLWYQLLLVPVVVGFKFAVSCCGVWCYLGAPIFCPHFQQGCRLWLGVVFDREKGPKKA